MNEMSSGQFVSPSGSLPSLASDELGRLLIAACDIVLVLSKDGTIVDLSVGTNQLSSMNLHDWIGKEWASVVSVDSVHKVNEFLTMEFSDTAPARQINHVLPDGRNRLIEYQLLNFPNQPNRIAVGRDFGALERVQQQLIEVQHMMERDHHRLRQCETRYRVMMQSSEEAMLVLDGRNECVLEANPAAGALLGADSRKLIGQPLSRAFDKEAREKVSTVLATAAGSNDTSTLRLAGDEDRSSLSITLSRFRAGDATQLLVKLKKNTPALDGDLAETVEKPREIVTFFQNALDALVVTDSNGLILSANSSFVELVEMIELEAVVGQTLSTWLGRQSVDYQVIMNSLRDKQSLRLFRTEMVGHYGLSTEVELSAQVNSCKEGQTYGFCIRNVNNRTGAANDESTNPTGARNPDELAELIGRVPLKELVRESTEVIEQLSIEEALKKTGNNRASAAELLGVSRQSLYVKLRRYGLDSAVADG